jgi:hypothetical protein
VRRFAIATTAAAGLLLAACQTAPQDYVGLHANLDPKTVAELIADNVGACWFDGSREAFANYSYAPELSSEARPRVLIVEKTNPTGLPQLVIEVEAAKRGSDVRLFGPLMSTAEGERIRSDVAFWAGGGRTCR